MIDFFMRHWLFDRCPTACEKASEEASRMTHGAVWMRARLGEVEAEGVEAELGFEPAQPVLQAFPQLVVRVVQVCAAADKHVIVLTSTYIARLNLRQIADAGPDTQDCRQLKPN